jgi:predicted AlkP superfamily pyrophosphatase or phosphodiesterase
MNMRAATFFGALSLFDLVFAGSLQAQQQSPGPTARKVIIFVYDGLRADDVTSENMPNYFALARSGVVFADHHAVYPTFTMMNSASIATGTYPGVHGFYGNVVTHRRRTAKTQRGSISTFPRRRSSRTLALSKQYESPTRAN